MKTVLDYNTRVVQEGGRRCKKSTLNDLVHLTPLRIPLMNPPQSYVKTRRNLGTDDIQKCKLSLFDRSNRDLKQWHNNVSASFLTSNWFGRKALKV
jgi:hypothetical protein